VIDVRHVTKRYYNVTALNNVTLTVPRGEVVGVLGPNGAGKTTLFKLIAGFLQPDSGSVRPIGKGVWPRMGYKPEHLIFPNQMKVREFLRFSAELSNIEKRGRKQAVDRVLQQVGLTAAADKKVVDCSKGMRQRLGLGQVLLGDPQMLILDEPSNGLDPEGQEDILQQIEGLRNAGKTILFSSHQLHEVTQICTHLIILKLGRIHYQNNMAKALSLRPNITILLNRDASPLSQLLHGLHPAIEISQNRVILPKEALHLRRPILSLLLTLGYDIHTLNQSRITLAEIYAEVVK